MRAMPSSRPCKNRLSSSIHNAPLFLSAHAITVDAPSYMSLMAMMHASLE